MRESNFVSTPLNRITNANETPCPLLNDTSCLATPGADIGPFIFLGQNRPIDLDQSVYALFAEVNVPIGDTLELTGAIRYEDFKVHIKEGHGGLPGMDFYNVKRDPGEKYGQLYPGLFAVSPIQMFIGSHMQMIGKFPHRDPAESKAKGH